MKQLYRYKIADLIVEVRHDSSVLARNGAKYETDAASEADITIDITDEQLNKALRHNSKFDRDYAEYFLSGLCFYQKLIPFGGFMLHSSCVAVDGKGYMFAADSGTGKSTHTSLWKDYLGDRVSIINDDKPAIRYNNGKFTVYGTPWSGKNDESVNCCADVSAVVFLERGNSFDIKRISGEDAVSHILPQLLHYVSIENADVQFDMIDKLLKTVPVFVMKCTPHIESAESAWKYLSKEC